MAMNPRERTALLMLSSRSVAMMPPCRYPGWPSQVSGMVARLTTDRSLAKENSSCNPVGLAWPQPKQRFSATWARGVRFSWAEVIELSIVRQDFRVGLLIDVAAAQNDPDALPISLFVLLQ